MSDFIACQHCPPGSKRHEAYCPASLEWQLASARARANLAEQERDTLKAALQSLDHKMEQYGEHAEACPGSHPAYCTCEVGNWRRAIRAALKST